MKKVFIQTVYKCCENASFLSTKLEEFFNNNNYQIVSDINKADLLIINGCSFVKECRDETEKYVKKYLDFAENKDSQVILTGCSVNAEKDKYKNIPNLYLISYNHLQLFNKLISKRKTKGFEFSFCQISSNHSRIMVPGAYYVKIADGCANNCSYCIIKKGKGELKSRYINDITNDLKNILKKNHSLGPYKIILLADDCGSYGFDINIDIVDLLKKLIDLPGEFKLYLHYFFPGALIKFFDQLKEIFHSEKIAFINIPIQSADQEILRKMNRNYSIDKVIKHIKFIKKNYPNIILHTHFIVNFSGETEAAFLKSLEAADYFNRSIFFNYSPFKCNHSLYNYHRNKNRAFNRKINLIKKKQRDNPFKYHFYDFDKDLKKMKTVFVDKDISLILKDKNRYEKE